MIKGAVIVSSESQRLTYMRNYYYLNPSAIFDSKISDKISNEIFDELCSHEKVLPENIYENIVKKRYNSRFEKIIFMLPWDIDYGVYCFLVVDKNFEVYLDCWTTTLFTHCQRVKLLQYLCYSKCTIPDTGKKYPKDIVETSRLISKMAYITDRIYYDSYKMHQFLEKYLERYVARYQCKVFFSITFIRRTFFEQLFLRRGKPKNKYLKELEKNPLYDINCLTVIFKLVGWNIFRRKKIENNTS